MTAQWEKHIAIVTRLNEANDGTFFVKSVGVTGDPNTELPDPVRLALPWGWFLIPDVGDTLEIEWLVRDDTEDGIAHAASVESFELRWRGTRFDAPEGEVPVERPEDFDPPPGKRRGFYTPAGHVLWFDDDTQEVLLRHADGSSEIQIDANGTINVTAANVHINSGGDADQFLVRGDELKSWIESALIAKYDGHKHPTAFGPSGTPLPTDLLAGSLPSTVLSTAGKVR